MIQKYRSTPDGNEPNDIRIFLVLALVVVAEFAVIVALAGGILTALSGSSNARATLAGIGFFAMTMPIGLAVIRLLLRP